MRKLLIAVCVLALMPYVASALTQAEWDAVKAQEAKEAKAFEEYKELRAEAKAAFAAGDYEKAAKLYEQLAEGDHCARLTKVKAWQLNNAAFALLNADKKIGKALDLLLEAKRIAKLLNEEHGDLCMKLLKVVDKNIDYCEENLKK